MKKMPTVFVRDFTKRPRIITPEVTPGCEWVLAGEGVASKKWDGTCVLIRDGKLYARYDAKHGKTPPEGFEPCQRKADPVTGHWPGWLLVEDQPQYKWHREGLADMVCIAHPLVDGTYELIGPKINANPEGAGVHMLRKHGDTAYEEYDRSFEGIERFVSSLDAEGIVFAHPDGRMAKIKRSDFGLRWPVG